MKLDTWVKMKWKKSISQFISCEWNSPFGGSILSRLQHGLSREYERGKYHCTIDLLFDWFGLACLQTKTKIVSYHTADSKPVKQEVNSTVILLPLVFPGLSINLDDMFSCRWSTCGPRRRCTTWWRWASSEYPCLKSSSSGSMSWYFLKLDHFVNLPFVNQWKFTVGGTRGVPVPEPVY